MNVKKRALWALAAVVLIPLAGCTEFENKNDPFEATATVVAADGETPLANFPLKKYVALIDVRRDGSSGTIVKEYAGPTDIPGTQTQVDGIITDENGQWSDSSSNLALSVKDSTDQCYEACVDWDQTCTYNNYTGDYDCYSQCNWTSYECESINYTLAFNWDNVTDVTSSISYRWNGIDVTTFGQELESGRPAELDGANQPVLDENGKPVLQNKWVQRDLFVTPIEAGNASNGITSLEDLHGKFQTLTVKGIRQPLRKAKTDLTPEEVQAVESFRAAMGFRSNSVK